MICFHSKSKKFIISKHVIHDEDLFPYKSMPKSQNSFQGIGPQDQTHVSSPIHSPIFLPRSVSLSNDVSSHQHVEGHDSIDIDMSRSTTTDTSLHSSSTLSNSSPATESETTSSSSSIALVLPVLDPAQLEEILPFA